MKQRLLQLVLCLTTSLVAVATDACVGQDSSLTPPEIVKPLAAPQHFAVEDIAAAAGSDPMMAWSNPPAVEPARPLKGGRYRNANRWAPSSNGTALDGNKVSGTADFVSDDNVSATIRSVALEAGKLTGEGLKLATKGAVFSARAKFIESLELIADARDARHQTQFHSRALAAGLFALREADDFSHTDTAAGCDPVGLAAGHSTPLIKNAAPNTVTRLQALQLYYSYATCQLSAAVGGVPEASMALYYLGRLQPFLGDSMDRTAVLAEPKSMALQQAAVLADARNYRAANELGVLLVNCGQLKQARKALVYGASIVPRPEILQNLAIVYKRLGDEPRAESMTKLAKEEQRHRVDAPADPATRPLIYLVDHKTFEGETPAAVPPTPSAPGTASDRTTAMPEAKPRFAGSASLVSGPWVSGPAEIAQPLSWDIFAQGEYIGPARLPHVPDYFLRVDDQIGFVFRVNGKPTTTPYRLNVGDTIRIGSLTMPNLAFDTPVQPDGTIILPQVGPVTAAGKSIETLRTELDRRFREYIKEPSVTVAPLSINRTLEEFRTAVTNRNGIFAGQAFHSRVTPDGTVQLPAIGSLPAQGLTLRELGVEIETRYAAIVPGFEVTPVLTDRAPRSVYVLGEVAKPGKFPLDAPTSVIQAVTLAGGWNVGANLSQVIIFRRDDEWRLMATRVNIHPALYNSKSLRADDIWLRDSDVVIVPKCVLQVLDDYIGLIFTKGIYGIVPFGTSLGFFRDLTPAAVTPI